MQRNWKRSLYLQLTQELQRDSQIDEFIQQFILSTCHVADTVLNPKDTLGSKTESVVSLDFHFKRERELPSRQINN